MAKQRPVFDVTSQYDAFLFSPIRDEPGGMQLSVLSALARMDFDPWEEAARLAALPTPEAERTLVAILKRLRDKRHRSAENEILAARLVALLPKATPSATARVSKGAGGPSLLNTYWVAWLCFAIAVWFLSPQQLATTTGAATSTATVSADSRTQGNATENEDAAANDQPDFGEAGPPTQRPPE